MLLIGVQHVVLKSSVTAFSRRGHSGETEAEPSVPAPDRSHRGSSGREGRPREDLKAAELTAPLGLCDWYFMQTRAWRLLRCRRRGREAGFHTALFPGDRCGFCGRCPRKGQCRYLSPSPTRPKQQRAKARQPLCMVGRREKALLPGLPLGDREVGYSRALCCQLPTCPPRSPASRTRCFIPLTWRDSAG